jgi:hypothetical protein
MSNDAIDIRSQSVLLLQGCRRRKPGQIFAHVQGLLGCPLSGPACVKTRASGECAELFSPFPSAVLFLFNVIETKFLRASSTSEFSHRLGPFADIPQSLTHVRFTRWSPQRRRNRVGFGSNFADHPFPDTQVSHGRNCRQHMRHASTARATPEPR